MNGLDSFLPQSLLTDKDRARLQGVRGIELVSDLPGLIGSLWAKYDLPGKVLLVADENTYAALGEQLAFQLVKCCNVQLYLLEKPRPTKETASQIADELSGFDMALAVGSGSINDLCKYSSFIANRPYMVAATAPSMNGYLSSSASIISNGHKKSVTAHLPIVALFDLNVMISAPPRLVQSGLGDVSCRPTAQADWLLSHLLLDSPYSELPFKLTAPFETELFETASGLLHRDKRAMELLCRSLIASGLGMTLAAGSYPASGGEHMIAHAYEMLLHPYEVSFYHGEQIAITTLHMAKLQEKLLASTPQLMPLDASEKALSGPYGKEIATSIMHEWNEKIARFSVEQLNKKIATHWPEIRKKISQVTIPAHRLEKILASAGIATDAETLGYDLPTYEKARLTARYTRNRFTFLDLI